MITKYDTSFSSSGKSATTTLLTVGVALFGAYVIYQQFFAKPKEEKQPQ